MIPSDHTAARRAIRRECSLMALLGDLAAEDRRDAFDACRDALLLASTLRHSLAAVELREARESVAA